MLRAAGHDAMTTRDQGMTKAKDPVIAQVCRAEGRARVTFDLDFGDVRAFPPGDHPGLIVLRAKHPDKPTLLRLTEKVAGMLETVPLAGMLWIVTEERYRVR